MAKLASVLAALCFLIALSHASELEATSVDLDTPRPDRTDLLIQLPKAESEHPTEKQPDQDSPAELTTFTIRPADFKLDRSRPISHSFRFPLRRGHGKPCRHGRRPLRPVELPIGTDMISSDENKGPGDLEGQRPFKWVRFHHQGEPKFGDRFEVETQIEVNGMGRPHRHHHHHHRFEREEDNEEKDGHHYHHHHHHHDHHEREAGFLGKIRKFLTHGF